MRFGNGQCWDSPMSYLRHHPCLAQKEYKYDDPPSSQPLLDVVSPLPGQNEDGKETKGSEEVKEAPDHHASSSTATTSISQTLADSVRSSGTLNLLLIDDQTVSWLSATDARYSLGVKLCAWRDQ